MTISWWSEPRILKVLNQTVDVIVVAGKEKFQGLPVLSEQQTHFQSSAAFKNIFPQPPDGNPAVRVRMAEAIGDRLKRRLDAGKIHIAQMLQCGVKARA